MRKQCCCSSSIAWAFAKESWSRWKSGLVVSRRRSYAVSDEELNGLKPVEELPSVLVAGPGGGSTSGVGSNGVLYT